MADRQSWRPILFDCPQTGHKVQGMIAEETFAGREPRYEAVACLACAGVHFVDPAHGKVLGAPRDSR
jgi:hypothetical protein